MKYIVVIALSLAVLLIGVAAYFMYYSSNGDTPPVDLGIKYNVILIVSDALREGNFKLICRADQTFELYDISTDAEERNNLTLSRTELVRSMYEKIKKIRENIDMRQKENLAAFYDDVDQRSPSERRRILQQLKSLGDIK
jgi:hypothetical protein